MKSLLTKNQEPQQNSYSLKTVPQTLEEMEKLLVLLVLTASCYSQAQDLSGKALVFPKRSTTDYVTLKPEKTDGLKAMTVCLRFISGDKNEQTLFSMATSGHHNSPLLYKHADGYEVYMRVGTSPLVFNGLPNELNKWHSYCFTWESITGLVQLWVDGVGGKKQVVYKSGSVEADPSIILGQEQDKRIFELDAMADPHEYIFIGEAGFNQTRKRKRRRNIIGRRAVKCKFLARELLLLNEAFSNKEPRATANFLFFQDSSTDIGRDGEAPGFAGPDCKLLLTGSRPVW
ncbi:hypothetical protein AGOR_G00100270 [Albula goreensis]|uniref:Pentraxin (PTX) domain-containing protein n=1 Tax=Albula goreensis TaxID=1534307 RepID=A0A8T3DHH2_9TELE|nr:hypothetical protein AGOR_G00100270 [Albula goreensis]